MGFIWEVKHGWFIELRLESVRFFNDSEVEIDDFEIDYRDLDDLEAAVKKAQVLRRDKKP